MSVDEGAVGRAFQWEQGEAAGEFAVITGEIEAKGSGRGARRRGEA
jgi:hypothetical protein